MALGARGRRPGSDIIAGLAVHGPNLLDMSAENVMSHPVVACSPDDSLALVMRAMAMIRCQHLPVLSQGELVGVISMVDGARARLADAEVEAAALRDVLAPHM